MMSSNTWSRSWVFLFAAAVVSLSSMAGAVEAKAPSAICPPGAFIESGVCRAGTFEQALAVFVPQCAAGDAASCDKVIGQRFLDWPTSARDDVLKSLSQGCQKSPAGCLAHDAFEATFAPYQRKAHPPFANACAAQAGPAACALRDLEAHKPGTKAKALAALARAVDDSCIPDNGTPDRCAFFGRMLLRHAPARVAKTRTKTFRNLCKRGHQSACDAVGDTRAQLIRDYAQEDAAVAALRRRCHGGEGKACLDAAKTVKRMSARTSAKAPPMNTLDLEQMNAACLQNDDLPPAERRAADKKCREVLRGIGEERGRRRRAGVAPAGDYRAIALNAEGCALGEELGCLYADLRLTALVGDARNTDWNAFVRLVDVTERGCKAGRAPHQKKRCVSHALMWEQAWVRANQFRGPTYRPRLRKWIAEGQKKGAKALDDLCRREQAPSACARNYWKARGEHFYSEKAAGQQIRAAGLLACRLGEQSVCSDLDDRFAKVLEWPASRRDNRRRLLQDAQAHFVARCQSSAAQRCREAGDFVGRPSAAKPNRKTARALYARGCETGGDKDACARNELLTLLAALPSSRGDTKRGESLSAAALTSPYMQTLKAACAVGHPESCLRAASIADRVAVASADEGAADAALVTAASAAWARTCDLGFTPACEADRSLRRRFPLLLSPAPAQDARTMAGFGAQVAQNPYSDLSTVALSKMCAQGVSGACFAECADRAVMDVVELEYSCHELKWPTSCASLKQRMKPSGVLSTLGLSGRRISTGTKNRCRALCVAGRITCGLYGPRCEAGEANACVAHGETLRRNYENKKRDEDALPFYHRACVLSEGRAGCDMFTGLMSVAGANATPEQQDTLARLLHGNCFARNRDPSTRGYRCLSWAREKLDTAKTRGDAGHRRAAQGFWSDCSIGARPDQCLAQACVATGGPSCKTLIDREGRSVNGAQTPGPTFALQAQCLAGDAPACAQKEEALRARAEAERERDRIRARAKRDAR